MAEKLGKLIGALFAVYFFIYPIIYFGWNYIIETLGYSQYIIPGFWFGMLCYALFNVVKNTLIINLRRIFVK